MSERELIRATIKNILDSLTIMTERIENLENKVEALEFRLCDKKNL